MRSAPVISVLLPVRNAATTLVEAIESIRSQTMAEWELVAVDDGSTDDSPAVLERMSRRDSRIRVIRRPQSGIVESLEAARTEARAPLLARMDADDCSAPSRLQRQVEYLQLHPEVALCGAHVRYFPDTEVGSGTRRYEHWLNSIADGDAVTRNIWVECPLAHPTFAMRAAALAEIGGYRDEGWPEDYGLVLRLWEAGQQLGVVPEVLLHWREGADRLSRTHSRYAPVAFRRIKLNFLARTLLKDRDGIIVWGAGRVGKSLAREALRQGLVIRAFADLHPRRIGQEIHGAPVLHPDSALEFRDSLALAAVGQPGARQEIHALLTRTGWQEGVDFVAVA